MTLFSVLATLPVSGTVTGKTVFPDLPSLLEAQSDKLSSLSGWLATQPLIASVLGRAGEVTLLAPSNDAISAISESPFGTQLEEDSSLLTAYLAYHVFPGVWPLEALADATDPVFPMTLMNYAGFANVTGGQVLRSVVRDGVVFLGSGGGAESPVIAAVSRRLMAVWMLLSLRHLESTLIPLHHSPSKSLIFVINIDY
jgi:hypothetical protein